jgi:predicted GNAT family N-acyltransferase
VSRPRGEPAGPADWPEITALRTRVFVDEQGVPPELERDALDATAVHAVSRDASGQVVATGRLVEHDGVGIIGRMAAATAVRGLGHGRAVLEELHWQAVLRGLRRAELHSQLSARHFYERAGYAAVGGPYREAGIPHITMRRSLPVLRPAEGAEADVLLGRCEVADRRWVLDEGGALVAAVAAVEGETAALGVAVGGPEWQHRLARIATYWMLNQRRRDTAPPWGRV